MPKDMRSWIQQLEAAGVLRYIRQPVDPRTQMGALLYQSRDHALFFQELTGFPGWRALGQAPANPKMAAIAMEVQPEQLTPEIARRILQRGVVRLVESGPVKEKILRGEELDLRTLPIHQSGAKDGGPFISGGLVISRDPDTGIRNMAFHRLQLKGRDKTGILLVPRHTALIYRKYEERGEPMPIAVVIGHHPGLYFAASTTGPLEMDELEVAASLLGEELPLVKCETVDLEVPSHAEVVLEGEILPHLREEEGPFAEFQDYYVAGMGKNPVTRFHTLTMRHDAIFKNVQNGSEVEGCVYHKVPFSAHIFNRIKSIGGFVDLHNVMILPGIFALVVQMNPRYYGEAKNVLMGALSSDYLHPRIAIAVDPDVDIFDSTEVLWAISTRVNPSEDIVVIPGTRMLPMDPTARELFPPGDPFWQRLGSKLIIDATKPPQCDPSRRQEFERVKPMGFGSVFLKDFL